MSKRVMNPHHRFCLDFFPIQRDCLSESKLAKVIGCKNHGLSQQVLLQIMMAHGWQMETHSNLSRMVWSIPLKAFDIINHLNSSIQNCYIHDKKQLILDHPCRSPLNPGFTHPQDERKLPVQGRGRTVRTVRTDAPWTGRTNGFTPTNALFFGVDMGCPDRTLKDASRTGKDAFWTRPPAVIFSQKIPKTGKNFKFIGFGGRQISSAMLAGNFAIPGGFLRKHYGGHISEHQESLHLHTNRHSPGYQKALWWSSQGIPGAKIESWDHTACMNTYTRKLCIYIYIDR